MCHPEPTALSKVTESTSPGTGLETTIRDGEPVYPAHGKVDFLGEEAMARTDGSRDPILLTDAV
jgi:hypothetical protein